MDTPDFIYSDSMSTIVIEFGFIASHDKKNVNPKLLPVLVLHKAK